MFCTDKEFVALAMYLDKMNALHQAVLQLDLLTFLTLADALVFCSACKQFFGVTISDPISFYIGSQVFAKYSSTNMCRKDYINYERARLLIKSYMQVKRWRSYTEPRIRCLHEHNWKLKVQMSEEIVGKHVAVFVVLLGRDDSNDAIEDRSIPRLPSESRQIVRLFRSSKNKYRAQGFAYERPFIEQCGWLCGKIMPVDQQDVADWWPFWGQKSPFSRIKLCEKQFLCPDAFARGLAIPSWHDYLRPCKRCVNAANETGAACHSWWYGNAPQEKLTRTYYPRQQCVWE